ncbi:hypothetical protein NUSPORA_02822 [Nucleospora cyclopteri]
MVKKIKITDSAKEENNTERDNFEKLLNDLTKIKSSKNTDRILNTFDGLIEKSSFLEADQLAVYCIDYDLKEILKNNQKSEIIEKVEDLLFLIRDPRNFYNEIISCLYSEKCSVPTLMLIFVLERETSFCFEEYDEFVVNAINELRVTSEGFLFFLLQNIQRNILQKKRKESHQIINKLIFTLPHLKDTRTLVKVLYIILVALRMHPSSFSCIRKEKLVIFTKSLKTVAQIVNRIFLEAKNPEMRPKTVFLENFSFPEIKSRQQEIK